MHAGTVQLIRHTHGTAYHSIAQHRAKHSNAAQRSPAQLSAEPNCAAQHSTAQHMHKVSWIVPKGATKHSGLPQPLPWPHTAECGSLG